MATVRILSQALAMASSSVLIVAMLTGCGGNNNTSSSVQSSSVQSSVSSVSSQASSSVRSRPSGPPVQTPGPNATGQVPAFPEQTRAPEMSTNEVYQTTTVASNLVNPWGLTFMPDGRMLVTERPGRLRIVTQSGSVSAAISGVPAVFTGGQGGLLDVNIAPDFATSRMVYFSYAENRGNNENGTSVARGRLSNDEQRLENVQVIFRQMPPWNSSLHFGSRLVWSPEGYLYVTLGERSLPATRGLAQDLGATLGKILRINADGSSPDSNPFSSTVGLPEIWSYGHRNVQGADINPLTGELWTIEHGPRGGDELNRPQAGKNYGWPIITYGLDYSGAPIGAGITKQSGMEQPLYFWDPVIAPSGMSFYSGDMFPEWKNDLFIASLSPGGVVRLMLDGTTVIGEQRILSNFGRVRDIAQASDGALWFITDASNGKVVRIAK